MVTIACVKVGRKYSDEYVLKLRAGVAKHLPVAHEFVCFTDKPIDGVTCRDAGPLPGWWAKISLFSLGQPLLYFDLDLIIVGDLTPIVEWDGFGIMRDPKQPGVLGSAVMKLTGNERHVWDEFRPDIMSKMHGDQDWITRCMPQARTFPPQWFPSFKFGAMSKPPEGALAMNFHGFPKPHQVTSGWVKEAWVST